MRIDPSFIASLPDDPDEAFVQIEEYLSVILKEHSDNNDWMTEQFYINGLHEFAIFVGDNELQKITDVNILEDDKPWVGFAPVRNYVEKRIIRSSFKIGANKKKNSESVRITADVRQKIQTYISHIRTAVHSIDLPILKKEAILRALSKLSLEVDTDRTWFESVADLAIRLSDTVDEVDQKLNPIRRIFEKILKRLGEAKAEEEALSKPEEPAPLEGPETGSFTSMDDEIPF